MLILPFAHQIPYTNQLSFPSFHPANSLVIQKYQLKDFLKIFATSFRIK